MGNANHVVFGGSRWRWRSAKRAQPSAGSPLAAVGSPPGVCRVGRGGSGRLRVPVRVGRVAMRRWHVGYRERSGQPAVHRGLLAPWLPLVVTLDEPVVVLRQANQSEPRGAYDALVRSYIPDRRCWRSPVRSPASRWRRPRWPPVTFSGCPPGSSRRLACTWTRCRPGGRRTAGAAGGGHGLAGALRGG